LDAYRATGGEAARPYGLALPAIACQKAGQPEEGLTLLAEALATAHTTGEGWWEAELDRLRGELLSQQAVGQPGEAATWLQRALAVAHRQEAKSLELRAAMSLVEPGRNYPSLYTVNGRPLYVHLNGLAIVLLK
jgi:predicted ATPase